LQGAPVKLLASRSLGHKGVGVGITFAQNNNHKIAERLGDMAPAGQAITGLGWGIFQPHSHLS